MWAHHPAAPCCWTVMHSIKKTICAPFLSLACSLGHLLVFHHITKPSESLHRMCASCVWALAVLLSFKCWNVKFPFTLFPHDFSRHCSQIFLTQNEVKSRSYCTLPKDDLYLNPYLDWRLHVEFGIGDESVLLVSRRQRSWMLLLSEIPEQENMQNFPKWVQYHYLMFQSALSLSQSGVFVT